jgi:hypothetical protein
LTGKGNQGKNVISHKVENQEGEEVFFDDQKKIFKDKVHSENEEKTHPSQI